MKSLSALTASFSGPFSRWDGALFFPAGRGAGEAAISILSTSTTENFLTATEDPTIFARFCGASVGKII